MCLDTPQNIPKEPWVFNEIGIVHLMRYEQNLCKVG